MDECRLPFSEDNCYAFTGDFVLAVFVYGNFFSLRRFAAEDARLAESFCKKQKLLNIWFYFCLVFSVSSMSSVTKLSARLAATRSMTLVLSDFLV